MLKKLDYDTWQEEIDIKVIEVPKTRIAEILQSNTFGRALFLAAKETKKSGYETGFNVGLCGSRTYIPDVRVGGTDCMAFNSIIEVLDDDADTYDEYAGEILSLHFHPNAEGVIRPSSSDLTSLVGVDCNPSASIAIGQVRKNGAVYVLLIKGNGLVVSDGLDDYAEYEETETNQAKIQKILAELGFTSILLSFHKDKRKYVIDNSSITSLQSFGSLKVLSTKTTYRED